MGALHRMLHDRVLQSVKGVGGGFAFATPTSWENLHDINVSKLPADFDAGDSTNAYGDSTTQGGQGQPGDTGVQYPEFIASNYYASAFINEGIDGLRSDQLLTNITAAAASGTLDEYYVIVIGTNDAAGAITPAQTLSNIASIEAILQAEGAQGVIYGVYLKATTIPGGDPGYDLYEVHQGLRAAYGNRVIDWREYMAQSVSTSGDAADLAAIVQGEMPPSLLADGLHPNDPGYTAIAPQTAAASMAMSGGKPFLHHEVVSAIPTSSQGSVLHQVRHIGSPTEWQIVGGNDDNAFSINSSGQVLRGPGAWDGTVRELYVAAGNASGQHGCRLVMLAGTADDDFSLHTDWREEGVLETPEIWTSTESAFTVLMRFKPRGTATNNKDVIQGPRSNAKMGTGTNATEVLFKNAANTTLAFRRWNISTTDYATVGFSFDGTNAREMQDASGSVVTPLSTGSTIDMSGRILMGLSGSVKDRVDVDFIWMANSFIDLSSASIRDQIINSGTLEPAFAANGVVDGVTPQLFLYGGPGDWALGRNRGTGGDLLVRPYVTPALANFALAT